MSEGEQRRQRSRALVAERLAILPRTIADALARPADLETPMLARARGTWVITGVGASSGPARSLAATLRADLELAAEYVPLSAFLEPRASAPRGDVLVVFSQRLSPNALLPLADPSWFAERWVVTTLDPDRDPHAARLTARGVKLLVHPPEQEGDLFLRMLGPPAATACALRWVLAIASALGRPPPAWERRLPELPPALERAVSDVNAYAHGERLAAVQHVAFVASASSLALASALPLKWIEGVGGLEPPLWDVLGFVHGPLQALYERDVAVVALEARGEGDRFDRLARVLHPERHALARLAATLPPPLSLFEHDALVGRAIEGALKVSPRDLLEWPGKGKDGPLYRLGSDEEEGR
jgi:hypothetical protein